ncbi:hypothetical protein B0H13DRAFT_1853164 [Mycena leptocephala]|nr:hypothetical protein B0H13DRAFT_1853164 [Mycena leptocephala]
MPSSVIPPRGMKRSSSVASLLTPSTRKRGGFSCNSNEDITAIGEYDDEGLFKRAANEESFWLAAESPSTLTLPLLHHHLQAQSQDQVDCPRQLSSPPSHRRSVVKKQTVPRTPTLNSMSSPVSPPRTPLLERRDSVFSIRRDSPENPFLVSPSGSDDDEVSNAVSGSQVERLEEAQIAWDQEKQELLATAEHVKLQNVPPIARLKKFKDHPEGPGALSSELYAARNDDRTASGARIAFGNSVCRNNSKYLAPPPSAADTRAHLPVLSTMSERLAPSVEKENVRVPAHQLN